MAAPRGGGALGETAAQVEADVAHGLASDRVHANGACTPGVAGEGLDQLRKLLKEAVIGGADNALKRADAASPPVAMPASDLSEPVGDRSETLPTGTYHSRA